MNLIITTEDCKLSKGFIGTKSPIAIALQTAHPEYENIEVHHNRISAERDGYPIRFAVQGFGTQQYRDLLYGTTRQCICTLKPLPVTQTLPHV